eukprot:327347-Chlamydomonas_euryale.AAC.2
MVDARKKGAGSGGGGAKGTGSTKARLRWIRTAPARDGHRPRGPSGTGDRAQEFVRKQSRRAERRRAVLAARCCVRGPGCPPSPSRRRLQLHTATTWSPAPHPTPRSAKQIRGGMNKKFAAHAVAWARRGFGAVGSKGRERGGLFWAQELADCIGGRRHGAWPSRVAPTRSRFHLGSCHATSGNAVATE